MPETNIERILERVNALFNLAANHAASATEKENAIKAAQKLISRHQLESLINKKGGTEEYDEFTVFEPNLKNRIQWKERLIYGICHINGCETIIRRTELKINYYTCFGKKENTKICKQLIELIIPQIEWFAREDKKQYEESIGIRKRGAPKDSFKLGCVQTVINKLNEAKEDEINSYVKETTLNETTKSGSNPDEFAGTLVAVVAEFKNELIRVREIMNSRMNIKKSVIKGKNVVSSEYQRGLIAGKKVNTNPTKMLK